ncbi:MAG TPA: DNA polymerase IV, partial [Erysipelothrix sp.]|nr:DNA polymerase IV [Erysipelothrix sp.]
MSARVLFHIDINAFYASAHLTIEPELEGKPVVVCRDVQGSVVTTASYEARQYGIGSAMPLSQAKRLCDDLVVVELDFELYNDLSQSFVNIIKSYSKTVEQASIDEVYVDVTDVIKTYDKPLDLAINIQKQLLDELKLPVSIGVGPNKFLAKMASDMDKPLGITVLRIREVETKLWPLAIDQMHGIGKKTVPRLKEIGVHTIGDLNNVSFDKVKLILGNRTQVFIDYANGLGSAKLNTDASAKSIGQSQTFSKAIFDYDELKEKILKEISQVE